MRIAHPVLKPELRRRAARRVAETSILARRLFPDDPRYFSLFSRLRPDSVYLAVSAENHLAGYALVRRYGRNPFVLFLRDFTGLYGYFHGVWLYLAYHLMQFMQAGRGSVYLCSVLVFDRYQSQGLGAQLMRRVIASMAPGEKLTLLARSRARSFFEKQGFALQGDLFASRGGLRAMRFVKPLPPLPEPALQPAR